MVRRASKKQRGKYTRKRKRVILIATEGKNKTETTYFSEFNSLFAEVIIVFANGNSTDPVKIVQDAINTAKNRGIDHDEGDKMFAVFDTDFSKTKQIEEARTLAQKNNIELILSNPCFEIWILLHFRLSTHSFGSNREVLNELINRWPKYQKNIESFEDIFDRLEIAIENSKKLNQFHEDKGSRLQTEWRNPSTDVNKLVEIINESGGDERQSK